MGLASDCGQKKFKQLEHRRERRAVKQCDFLSEVFPHPKQFGNEWDSPRDGKYRFIDTKWLRK